MVHPMNMKNADFATSTLCKIPESSYTLNSLNTIPLNKRVKHLGLIFR